MERVYFISANGASKAEDESWYPIKRNVDFTSEDAHPYTCYASPILKWETQFAKKIPKLPNIA